MQTSVQVFDFNNDEIRILTNEKGDPLFRASDVARVLGIQTNGLLARIPEDEIIQIDLIDSIGRSQPTRFLTLPGLFRAIFRSDSPKAENFMSWVFKEVLPTIAKDGEYLTKEKKAERASTIEFYKRLALHNEARLYSERSIPRSKIDIFTFKEENEEKYFTWSKHDTFVLNHIMHYFKLGELVDEYVLDNGCSKYKSMPEEKKELFLRKLERRGFIRIYYSCCGNVVLKIISDIVVTGFPVRTDIIDIFERPKMIPYDNRIFEFCENKYKSDKYTIIHLGESIQTLLYFWGLEEEDENLLLKDGCERLSTRRGNQTNKGLFL